MRKRKVTSKLKSHVEKYDPYLKPRTRMELELLQPEDIIHVGMEIESKQMVILNLSEYAMRRSCVFLFKNGQNTIGRVGVHGLLSHSGRKQILEVSVQNQKILRNGKWVWKVTNILERPPNEAEIRRHEHPHRDRVPYSVSILANVVADYFRTNKTGICFAILA